MTIRDDQPANTRRRLRRFAEIIAAALVAAGIGWASVRQDLWPVSQGAVQERRRSICNVVALHCALSMGRADPAELEKTLLAAVRQEPELLSVEVRDEAGDILMTVGDNLAPSSPPGRTGADSTFVASPESTIEVPIALGADRRGLAVFRFEPLPASRGMGPSLLVAGFIIAAASLAAMLVRERRRRRGADRRARATLDALAEAVVVLDGADRILAANAAFGRLVGDAPERLVSRRLAEFWWTAVEPGSLPAVEQGVDTAGSTGVEQGVDTAGSTAALPWHRAYCERAAQRGTILRLAPGARNPGIGAEACDLEPADAARLLSVNASPLMGADGACRGVLATFDDLTELHAKNLALEEARETLEAKVAERTSELVAANARLEAEIIERTKLEAELRQMPRMIVAAQEEERRRIARELHDGINQTLGGAKRFLELAGKRLAGMTRSGEFERADELLGQAIRELREIAERLRPGVLDDLGLAAAIRSLANQLHKRAGIGVDLARFQPPSGLSREIELAVYRIAQEALHNIEKHSAANEAAIELHVEEGMLVLAVGDDGKGMSPTKGTGPICAQHPPGPAGPLARLAASGRGKLDLSPSSPSSGMGLVHIRERAQLLGGTVEVAAPPEGGTRLVVRIPLGCMEDRSPPARGRTGRLAAVGR